MRLTCPNCNAQYEVPDEVIPDEGRDVQCSNCEKTWFQPKDPEAEPVTSDPAPVPEEKTAESAPEVAEASEPQATDPTPEPEDAEPAPEPEPKEEAKPATPGSNVDPAVASVLQQEAAREAELRAKAGTSLESQPDLGLDEPSKPVTTKRPAATETAKSEGQKDALPDVEAINSSLRGDDAPPETAPAETPPRKSGGFMRGFALILIIGVILFLIYGNARQIGEAVPQAEPAVQSYVSMIDQARIWLESKVGSAAE